MANARELLESLGKMKKDVVAVRVDQTIYDLHTTLPEGTTTATPIRATEDAGVQVIRHSSAHVMADAVQRLFPGTKVAFGPATETGFYYDLDSPKGSFTEEDLRLIEDKMKEIIEADHPFRREPVSKDEARKLLEDLEEPYKLEHLERLEGEITIYRHGDWLDLCEGPHVPSTSFLKAIQLTTVSGAYWRGDERNPMLQRIYGTAFGNAKALRVHLKRLEEAKKRDHRKLATELELIGFHPWAPASPFFMPRGATVYNVLTDYIRRMYLRENYQEVITPQIFDRKLFETSGHLPSYGDNMYMALTPDGIEDIAKATAKRCEHGASPDEAASEAIKDGVRYGVKPMNCPSHCLMYGMRRRSYRELPLRMADFGRLHRYERSGVVQGVTRVRTFSQDDAHIFCTLEQVQGEIGRFIDLLMKVYEDFEFTEVRVAIATRPEKRLGDDSVWDKSEAALIEGVKEKDLPFEILEGEGAFYGPKIEFHLRDAIGRPWQLGTIQADFNLPERFDLNYVGEDNTQHRPVMLHRAVLGSVERFMGVLIEHCAGKFPCWLAPEQISLVTVSEKFNGFAEEVRDALREQGIRAVADLSDDMLGAKIRNARNKRIPYIGVIGEKEVEAKGVALRSGKDQLGLKSIEELHAFMGEQSKAPSER